MSIIYKEATQQRKNYKFDSPLFGPNFETDLDKNPSALAQYQQNAEQLIMQTSASMPALESASLLNELLDISPVLNEAASAVVDDSFWRCFKSNEPEPWNWNLYLFPIWCIGLVIRHCIFFPLRLSLLLGGFAIFFAFYFPTHFLLKYQPKLRMAIEVILVKWMCGVFTASFTGVVKYHGPRPVKRPHQVFVANHTSMIDFIILEQLFEFAVIMQFHAGWVGFLQKTALSSLGCIWFNRTEANDRAVVARKLKEHVAASDSNPLLIFPEGTCVNNEYTVMFKKGAFELGCAVCPIAIKYNKTFVDAFWNSRQKSFSMYLLHLMTQWAVVADVWFLEPQFIQPNETSIEFAERVRDLIARKAGIKKVPWDGYLKYFRPSPKLTEKRQALYSHALITVLESTSSAPPTPK